MKPVYKCEYCDKIGDERTISIHESACNHNPENQTCYTCKHAVIHDYEVECGEFAISTGAKTCWEKGTVDGIEDAFKEAVDDYIKFKKEINHSESISKNI